MEDQNVCDVQKITLERIQKYVAFRLEKEKLKYDFDVNLNIVTGEMILRLTTDIWMEHNEGAKVKYPSSWWDHFKLEWFPVWMLKKYPVLWTTKELSIETHYPEIKIKREPHVVKSYIHYDYNLKEKDLWKTKTKR